jgi:4-phospho-D-threonate 3-dehydrogenase / 4-phospho-D-erythronate 3-dehydrogenase
MSTKTIAITVGDPAGIGPEITLKAAQAIGDRLHSAGVKLLLVGDSETLSKTGSKLGLPVPPVALGDNHAGSPIAILPTSPLQGPVETGQVSAEGGRQAYDAIRLAVEHAMSGRIDAIVTAPLNKEALHLAGYHYAGHTELLADLTGVHGTAMMLAHGNFRVSHVTTHCALEDVPKKATAERIRRVIDLTLAALQNLGIDNPRIAVAALNPHAGEGGLFGRHDIDVTAPIVEDYQARAIRVYGPVPGDTVFVKLKAGQYDAVIAMYHDQGHIPVKLLGFGIDMETGKWVGLNGVNVTLGLPIVRTSVDHGTAFDIADQGIAQPSSLIEAVDYALKLVRG